MSCRSCGRQNQSD